MAQQRIENSTLQADRFRDIQLLASDREQDRLRYACGRCRKLATETKVLCCDQDHHEQDTTLYCSECASIIQSQNKCPINDHQRPVFDTPKVPKQEIYGIIKFVCVYSPKYQQREPAQGGVAMVDTFEGKQDAVEARGCRWRGTYNELQQHVQVCEYKPKQEHMIQQIQARLTSLDKAIVGMQEVEQKRSGDLNQINDRLNTLDAKLTSPDVENFQTKIQRKLILLEAKNNKTTLIIMSIFCCIFIAVIFHCDRQYYRENQAMKTELDNMRVSMAQTATMVTWTPPVSTTHDKEQSGEIQALHVLHGSLKVRVDEMYLLQHNLTQQMQQYEMERQDTKAPHGVLQTILSNQSCINESVFQTLRTEVVSLSYLFHSLETQLESINAGRNVTEHEERSSNGSQPSGIQPTAATEHVSTSVAESYWWTKWILLWGGAKRFLVKVAANSCCFFVYVCFANRESPAGELWFVGIGAHCIVTLYLANWRTSVPVMCVVWAIAVLQRMVEPSKKVGEAASGTIYACVGVYQSVWCGDHTVLAVESLVLSGVLWYELVQCKRELTSEIVIAIAIVILSVFVVAYLS